ncbi:Spermidine/spermine synthase family [Cynara cardunculus var. scolymus]|uniref:thermospermine synthase n=1 Tax=Cynara cardunculus var. scolymus TaxID=59895 RepID=A0A103XN06_CYNCS|nr:Spermidine/spermine synthase family [Cynara cardunculus var. scolymus]
MGDISFSNANSNGNTNVYSQRKSCWYEEEIEENLRWCFALNSILHTGATQFQDIQLLDTKPFGKALVIDGKLQSAEIDEFIYHESLVHPALLHHPNPKTIFVMGGGEGSTARELLRHKTVNKVVMCDIDEEVVDFCKSYLAVNSEAFCDPRLELIINDARAELEKREDRYDVIIGDLADPIEGGPCYQLYTKTFYELTVKPKLMQGGIFVTQAGPAGVFSHTEVFSCIFNTLKQVFKCKFSSYLLQSKLYTPCFLGYISFNWPNDEQMLCHTLLTFLPMLTFGDGSWIKDENRYLDGKTFVSASTLSKAVRKSLDDETHVYTEGTARFIYGHGHGSANKNNHA